MGINQVPAASSGISSVVSSVQRGSAASSGNITISAVNTAKTMVRSFSTSADGTVATTGTLSAQTGNVDTIIGVKGGYFR